MNGFINIGYPLDNKGVVGLPNTYGILTKSNLAEAWPEFKRSTSKFHGSF